MSQTKAQLIEGTSSQDVTFDDATVNSLNGGPLAGTRNRIINGDMRIDQRNAGAAVSNGAADTYTIDRFFAYGNQASKFTVQRNAGSVTPPVGFLNYLGISSSSAYSVPTAETYSINQRVEGFNIDDLNWGTVNARAVTLSFWVRSSLTGTFGGCLNNASFNRYYAFSYSIGAANTWEYKTITILGDTTGTWNGSTGAGIQVGWSLGAGSTYSGTGGAWGSAPVLSVTGAVSVVGTNGATFYITGVQLEAGTVATPFERRSYGQELALCQRYFETSFSAGGPASTTNTDNTGVCAWGGGGNGAFNTTSFIGLQAVQFSVPKRATPTMAILDLASPRNLGKCHRHQLGVLGTDNQDVVITAGTGSFNAYSGGGVSASGIIFHYTAAAEL